MTCSRKNYSSPWAKIGELFTLSASQGSSEMEQPKSVDIDKRITNLPSDPKEVRGSASAANGLGQRYHQHQ